MKRRHFILSAVGGVGALVVGWGVLPPRSRLGTPADFSATDTLVGSASGPAPIALNGWIKIRPDGHVILAMPQAEMGQGVHTSLPMVVAEELDLPLNFVSVETAGAATIYGNIEGNVGILPFHPSDMQPGHATRTVRVSLWLARKVFRELGISITGGSSSVADTWEPLRLAAATARAQLIAAAAQRWAAPAEQISIVEGLLTHTSAQATQPSRRAHLGEFAAAAADQHVTSGAVQRPCAVAPARHASPTLGHAEQSHRPSAIRH